MECASLCCAPTYLSVFSSGWGGGKVGGGSEESKHRPWQKAPFQYLTAWATCLSTSCVLHGPSWRALSIPGAPGICPASSAHALPPCSSHYHVGLESWLSALNQPSAFSLRTSGTQTPNCLMVPAEGIFSRALIQENSSQLSQPCLINTIFLVVRFDTTFSFLQLLSLKILSI